MLTKAALAITLASSLALAGCNTTGIDNAVQKNLPAICASAEILYAGYSAAVANGSAKPNSAIDTTIAGLKPLCADPANQNSATVLMQVAVLYATLTSQVRKAKA